MAEPLALALAKSTSGDILSVRPGLANRHGLITGATGTGKTVTLQVMAEQFSRIGVPVVMADVKGDLSGIGAAGALSARMADRLAAIAVDAPAWSACPVEFWDVYGAAGHPVRATISDLGPLLLGRLLDLNDTQRGVLTLVFKIADDAGLLLLDAKDLRAMLAFVGENAGRFTTDYGHVSAASIGAIQRGLLALDEQGGDRFFGEPMLDVDDLLQTRDGRGVVNVLAADRLLSSPKLYATCLLWLLSELYERLPEVGDPPKPRLVFFFDEAHLLFDDAPDALVEKIEQVVRLTRSKGVGVYFVTQNPLDIPETVLGQLGHRVQHALRAFTPRDQNAVRTAARTLRQNPAIDTETAITELGVGEALVSLLDDRGAPAVVSRAWILPPASRIGPLTRDERAVLMQASVLRGHYDQVVDRESAYEKLQARAAGRQDGQTAPGQAGGGVTSGPVPQAPRTPASGSLSDLIFGSVGPRGGKREGLLEAAAKSAARSMGSGMGRQILRGVLGSMFGGRGR